MHTVPFPTPTAAPVSISRGYNNSLEQDAKLLQVIGWGITAWGDKVASPILMETELQVP